jgi:hypothetical protein
MGCCVREAGVEQEDKEKESGASDEHPMEEGGKQVDGRMGESNYRM